MSFFSTSSMVSVENAMKLTVSDSLIHCRMASVSSGLNLKLVWFFFPTSKPFGGKYPQHCSNAPKERCRSNMIQFLFLETLSERSGCLADIETPSSRTFPYFAGKRTLLRSLMQYSPGTSGTISPDRAPTETNSPCSSFFSAPLRAEPLWQELQPILMTVQSGKTY